MATRTCLLLISAMTVFFGCDTTSFFAIDNRPLTDIEVVSIFPAHIAADGEPTRVCGAPLQGEENLQANGFEVALNFVGAGVVNTDCAVDRDNSIKPRDEISLRPFIHQGEHATVAAGRLRLHVNCVEPRDAPGSACALASTLGQSEASSMRYEEIAPRCGKASAEITGLDVALVVDNSGSTIGLVDHVSLHEDQPGQRKAPSPLVPSDPHGSRTWAALRLAEQLNEADRIIGYWYDEKQGIQVAASDNRSCQGGPRDGKRCLFEGHCPGGACETGGAPEGNTLADHSMTQREQVAFGSSPEKRRWFETAMTGGDKYNAEGRAPLWPAVGRAYEMLAKAAPRNRQIVLLADGPDTCAPSEDFDSVGSDGHCRVPCNVAGHDFESLRQRMHADGWTTPIHIIQFQAPAYLVPDPAMMEIACRSGGTYQFINAQEMSLANGAFSSALQVAIVRVRRALSGSWRLGHRYAALAANQIVKTGRIQAVSGRIDFDAGRFACPGAGATAVHRAHFSPTAQAVDGRLVFRKPCGGHGSCGGASTCGPNRCTTAGLCATKPAADGLPCNDAPVPSAVRANAAANVQKCAQTSRGCQ